MRILHIDDDALFRKIVAGRLARAGHEVLGAVDGEDGITRFRDYGLDLVLTDIDMPRMDGYQTATALRQMNYTGPLIALSGRTAAGDIAKAILAGCDACLSKPLQDDFEDDLAARVARLLSQPPHR